MNQAISIHPRKSFYGNGPKLNTAKPHKGKGKLAWKQKHLLTRRNAHSLTIKGSTNPAAYRTPGSMKGRA